MHGTAIIQYFYEVNHFIHCHTQGNRAYMALKLDVSKAYDRIEWGFLEKILLKLGFTQSLVDFIMICVSSVSYSFLLNGSRFGRLTPNRGIRQGDPLSPYLFICCVEAFIQMIEAAVGQWSMNGIKVAPTAPVVSNLCFADDTILFTRATVQEAEVVRAILDKYAAASGQIINIEKSTMVFSPNLQATTSMAIHNILPFQVVTKFDKYLGLPARIGRTKAEIFSYLTDRMWARVRGWNEKNLSMAGREILIKSVLQAIPTYVMSCFKLPQSILDEAEKIIRRFWWGSKTSRGIYWLPWSRLCRTKAEEGMGFRDLESFNLALLTKQAWRIQSNPDRLLSSILQAKYFPRTRFVLADLGERPSLTWRSILEARPFLELGLRRRVGNGLNTHIWGDAWLLSEGSGKVITRRPMDSSYPDLVGDLIDASSGAWNLELLHQTLWSCDIPRVLQVPLGTHESEDVSYWFFSNNGHFTVRSCYHRIMEIKSGADSSTSGSSNLLEDKEWRWLWGLQLPPKVRTFLWRACNDIIPVRAAMVRRKMGHDPFRQLCNSGLENTAHPFFECPRFQHVWRAPPFTLFLPRVRQSFVAWYRLLRSNLDVQSLGLATVVCWRIWWIRNQVVHGESTREGDDVIEWASNYMESYRQAQLPRLAKNTPLNTIWVAPPETQVKVNFDVGFVGPSSYQIAVVARGADGTCLWWRVRKLTGQPPAVVGEARAALEGIILARSNGWREIILEGDCAQILAAMQAGVEDQFQAFGALLKVILLQARDFNAFSCSFIRRSGNKLAHALAHLSLSDLVVVDDSVLPADLALIN